MQTHDDRDSEDLRRHFLRRLSKRADAMVKNKQSEITAGKEGEVELASWKTKKMHIRHLPDDEQGIARISIGGGITLVPLDYCVIRGEVGQCIALLEQAIIALRKSP